MFARKKNHAHTFFSELPSAEATWEAWRNADVVCFDVDSTVIVEEGLDELAAHLGKGETIAAMSVDWGVFMSLPCQLVWGVFIPLPCLSI